MTKDFTRPVLAMPRFAKRLIVLLVDSSLAVVTIWLALYLRLGEFYAITGPYLTAALLAIGLGLPVFVVFRLYRAIFRYAGWPALLAVSKACAVPNIPTIGPTMPASRQLNPVSSLSGNRQ